MSTDDQNSTRILLPNLNLQRRLIWVKLQIDSQAHLYQSFFLFMVHFFHLHFGCARAELKTQTEALLTSRLWGKSSRGATIRTEDRAQHFQMCGTPLVIVVNSWSCGADWNLNIFSKSLDKMVRPCEHETCQTNTKVVIKTKV